MKIIIHLQVCTEKTENLLPNTQISWGYEYTFPKTLFMFIASKETNVEC